MDITESVASLLLVLKHTSQPWLAARCGSLLSQVLLKPGGLLPTLIPIVGIDLDSETVETVSLNEQLYRAAQLVTTVPKQSASPRAYFALIVPQAVDLILSEVPAELLLGRKRTKITSAQLKARFSETGALILAAIFRKDPQLAEELVLAPLLQPLFALSQRANPMDASIGIRESKYELIEKPSPYSVSVALAVIRALLTVQSIPQIISEFGSDALLLSLWRTLIFTNANKYKFTLSRVLYLIL